MIMKKTKLAILTLLCAFFTLSLYSQSRVNSTGSVGMKAKSEKLKSATGWKQDAMGGWVSNQNAISDIQLNEQTRYSVPQNFKWMQFVSFNIDNRDVYVLLYETVAYVSNSQAERRVYYYLISPALYAGLDSAISKKSGETFTIHSNAYGYMSDRDGIYSQEKLLGLIKHSLTSSNSLRHDWVVNAQHVDNADVVRFRLPEEPSILDGGLSEGYFEVKWTDFKSIMLPVTQTVVALNDEFDLDGGTAVVPAALISNVQPVSDDGLAERSTQLYDAQVVSTALSNPVQEPSQEDNSGISNADDNTQIISDRVSKESAVVSEPIAVLKNIQGWYFNAEGKWVPDSDHTYNFETVGGYEFRNFSYRGRNYLVITRYEKYAGVNYFLISKDEYVKEMSKLNTSPMLKFQIIAQCGVGNTIEDLIKKGEEAIDAPEKEKIIIRDSYLILQYRSSEVKNIARFFIYGLDCTQYGETGDTTCDVKVSNKVRYDEVSLIGTKDLFGKMYYEVSYADFNDFFKAPLRVVRPQEKIVVNNSDDGLGDRY